METKGKVRSFADIFGEDVAPVPEQQAGVTEIEISKLVPFENHPFRIYEGERLNDMVTSIRELGVILPVVVRPKENVYEILSGHNRVNAAKIAGLLKVPAVIKEGLSDEEANLIVTETNLMQRSFADLSYSERAVALITHYNAIKHQGMRSDLINEIEMLSKPHELNMKDASGQVVQRVFSREKTGECSLQALKQCELVIVCGTTKPYEIDSVKAAIEMLQGMPVNLALAHTPKKEREDIAGVMVGDYINVYF